jgi:translation initiation factor IF-2
LSKKPASLKVHQLAKELGVSSKDIVSRCQQEEIPDIANHLSPVSLGLAETVRKWFVDGAFASSTDDAAAVSVEASSAEASGSATATVTPTKRKSSSQTKDASKQRGSATTDAASTPGGEDDGSAASAEEVRVVAKRAKKKAATESAPAESDDAAAVVEAAPKPAAVEARVATPEADAEPTTAVVQDSGSTESSVATAAQAPDQGATEAPVTPQRPAAPAAAPARPAAPRMLAGLSATPPSRVDATTPKPPEPPAPGKRFITAPPPPPPSLVKPPSAQPVMNVPNRPSIVGPVGPQLSATKEKTKLSGPQLIRQDTPDNIPAPRPMRRPDGGTGTGGVGGARGGRVEGRGRIGSSRTGRAGDSARQAFGAQDIRDRQARLDSSKGFMTSHRTFGTRPSGGGGMRAGPKPGEIQQIHVAEPLTIKELSAATGVKTGEILKKLLLGGTMATINASIDREKAIEIMMDFDIDLIVEEAKSAAEIIEERFKDRERVDERRRAPIVTILGHVDHGKTSLLDRIRSTNIAAGEAGGITQSTRAFSVPVKAGNVDRVVTFIDTPGHEAFTSMRARGAKVTDIVVLVVSAVDGVMPQTIESINHAKAAGVPIVVAMNKIDRPDATEANIRRLLGQLAEHELNPVEWGGTTEVIKTSATRGDGIQELLEMLDYQAELLELKADFGGMARGTVLEAAIEEGRGPVARVMVQEGRLKKGDFIVIGRGYGRVRDIINDRGERITEAFPSTPVAISGIDQLPDAGDKAFVVESIRAAEEAAEERRRIDRERELAAPKITLDNIFKHLEKAGRKELALVVKGDVQGSVEALKAMLAKLPTEEVVVSVKSASAGGINESDVTLAEATKAIIVGFNVTSSGKARQLAESKGIEIRLYEVIYDLIDDVTKAARGLLAPELKLEVLGHAEVRQVFKISKVGAIAGCYVTDGVVERNAQIRVTRDGIVVEKDRRLEQLKRFKDDAKEVRAGNECGMKIVGYDDIKVGDVLECYKTVTVQRV